MWRRGWIKIIYIFVLIIRLIIWGNFCGLPLRSLCNFYKIMPGSCGLRSGFLTVVGFFDLFFPFWSQIWSLPTSWEKESRTFKLLVFFTRESKIKCSCINSYNWENASLSMSLERTLFWGTVEVVVWSLYFCGSVNLWFSWLMGYNWTEISLQVTVPWGTAGFSKCWTGKLWSECITIAQGWKYWGIRWTWK